MELIAAAQLDEENFRSCGDCSMCCKLLPIELYEGQDVKPAGEWCSKWSKRTKCGIYDERPGACREFHCLWRISTYLPNEMRPDKSKVVMAMYSEGVLIVYVDPKDPDAWQRGEVGLFLRQWPERFVVQCGEKRVWKQLNT